MALLFDCWNGGMAMFDGSIVQWFNCWNGGGAMLDGFIARWLAWLRGYVSKLAIQQDNNRAIEPSNHQARLAIQQDNNRTIEPSNSSHQAR